MNKFLLLILAFKTFASHGQKSTEPPEYWKPEISVFSQKYDWLKLRSGEWLKGDIVSMYDDELEFDSDEFNLVTFDWEDVAELRSRFDQQIRFASGEVKQGFLVVKDEHLVLISGGTEEHYPLSELLSITSSSDDRKELWDGKVSLGIDVNAGNVNQLDYLANATIQRRTPFTRFKVDFNYNYSKSIIDDVGKVITDTTRFTSYLDWFYTNDVFFRVFDFEHYSDLQQNIESRNTIGLSVGYHLVKDKRIKWDVTIGPSFQGTTYYDTDSTSDQQSGVVALGTLIDYSFSSQLDYILDYQLQIVEENSGKRNSHLKTGFEFEFRKNFDLDFTFYWDRVAKPVAKVDTIIPEANDYRLFLSLGYKF